LFAASLCVALALGLCAVVAPGVRSQSDAQPLRRITHTPERTLNLNPTISGDGRRIAFESTGDLTGANNGGAGFHTLRADITNDGATLTSIAASRAPAPALSRDGSHLAFASRENLTGENPDGNSEIFLFEGERLRQITNTTPRDAARRIGDGNFQPSISNDGKLLAFASNRDLTGANSDANLEIFVYDSDTRGITQISDTTGTIGASDAKLSGDGTRIAFIRDNGAAGSTGSGGGDVSPRRDLMLYERAQNSARVVAQEVENLALTYGRATSDDGERVVYAAQTAARTTQVFLYDGRNGQTRRLTSLGSRAADVPLHPTISGDGSRVAFATRRNVNGGNSDASVELYVYDLPENKISRVTNAPAAANAEVVSSLNEDGSLLAFNFPRILSETVSDSDLANNSEIYLARLAARTPFSPELQILNGASFGRETAGAQAANATVSPDQIAVARGVNLALDAIRAKPLPNGTFPQTLGGASLSVNGRSAQLFYASPTQINFVVPSETEIDTVHIVARNHDGYESRASVSVQPAAPGVFTERGDGSGAAIALDAETFTRSPFNPVDAGDRPRRLTIFSTGIRHAKNLVVTIGGRVLTVENVLPSHGLPGLDEIHVLLARSLAGAGTVSLNVRADGRESNPTTLTFTGTRRAASISLAPSSASIGVGRSVRFVAVVRDADGVEIANAPVAFTSTDESIATVDADGRTRGRRAGTATIKAASGDVAATAQVTVFPLSLTINEILADPPDGAAGDANHDGARSSTQDEFVELVNASTSDLNIGGYQLTVRGGNGADTVRHNFAPDTFIAPGTAIVVFGGALVPTFDPAHPAFAGALVQTASTGGLSLTNGGSTVKLLAPQGATIDELTYGGATDLDADRNQSLTRAPDIAGDFAPHETALASGGRSFSPGTRVDGSPFNISVPIARIEVAPATATVERGAQQQFTARAFDANGDELSGVAFRWQTSDATVATIDDNGLAQSNATGEAQIRAHARGVESAPATLRVLAPQPKITHVEIAPHAAAINRGGSLRFTAQAFDRDGRPQNDATFTWSSSDAFIATIDTAGLARGVGIGTVTITASTSDGAGGIVSQQASLEVRVPVVVNEIFADVPPDDPATVAVEGDANRDGVRSSDDDEFIELFNYSREAVDISGLFITDATARRFTFPAATSLAAGGALVVFGGGSPAHTDPAFGGATVFTTTSLGLNDAGDTVSLKLTSGSVETTIAAQSYGTAAPAAPPAPADQSLTRSPDAAPDSTGGNFIAHTLAPDAATRAASPGTRADGTPFGSPPISRISVFPPSATIEIGASQNFSARAYAMLDGVELEVPNVAFIWDSSDAGKASVAPQTGTETTARGISAGDVQIRARAGGREASAVLTIKPPPAVLTRLVLSPATATIISGGTQEFTAQAFDQYDQSFPVPSITFTSDNGTVASVDSVRHAPGSSAATATVGGHASGTARITATASDGTRSVLSNAATITVSAPPQAPAPGQVIINEVLVAFAASTTQARRDFVELYNTTDATLDITGLVVSFRPPGNANAPLSVTLANNAGGRFLIAPHGYFLIANGAETFGVSADFDASAGNFDLNNTTGGIKIEIGGVRLDGLAYQGGGAPPAAPFNAYGEGAIFTFTGGATNDIIRSPDAKDTDNNATDFRRNGTASSVSPKASNP
jgi:uncharacterized protein (TIGR03437 family)